LRGEGGRGRGGKRRRGRRKRKGNEGRREVERNKESRVGGVRGSSIV